MTAHLDVELRTVSFVFRLAEAYGYETIVDATPKDIRTKLKMSENDFNATMKAAVKRGEIILIPHHSKKIKMYMFRDETINGITLKPSQWRYCLIQDTDNKYTPDRHANHSDRNDCLPYPRDRWANYEGVYEERLPEPPKTNNQLPQTVSAGYSSIPETKEEVRYTPTTKPVVTYKVAKVTLNPEQIELNMLLGSDDNLYVQQEDMEFPSYACPNNVEAVRRFWKRTRKPIAWELKHRGYENFDYNGEVHYLDKETKRVYDRYGAYVGQYEKKSRLQAMKEAWKSREKPEPKEYP